MNRTKTVLLVDDDTALLELLGMEMMKYSSHFTTICAHSVDDALKQLEAHEIDLLITDMNMPGKDGFMLLARLRSIRPHLPCMVMSAMKPKDGAQVARITGVLKYFVKPFDVKEFGESILDVLEKHGEAGRMKGIAVSSFLQLIEAEQKTCSVEITNPADGQSGNFCFNEGSLVDARKGDVSGVEVAYEILGWKDVGISIRNYCPDIPSRINNSLQSILLEGARRSDEAARQ